MGFKFCPVNDIFSNAKRIQQLQLFSEIFERPLGRWLTWASSMQTGTGLLVARKDRTWTQPTTAIKMQWTATCMTNLMLHLLLWVNLLYKARENSKNSLSRFGISQMIHGTHGKDELTMRLNLKDFWKHFGDIGKICHPWSTTFITCTWILRLPLSCIRYSPRPAPTQLASEVRTWASEYVLSKSQIPR